MKLKKILFFFIVDRIELDSQTLQEFNNFEKDSTQGNIKGRKS
ncbi:DEAD/DEAH box helicase family protein [Rice orange leaf phytoplasma]